LEQAEPGAGLELYESYLDNGSEHFLEFVEETGLESPFDAQRVTTIRETLEKILTQEGKGQFTQE
jgi:hypothetical protein